MKDYEEVREQFRSELERLGITIDAIFVPFSQSRNAKDSPKISDYNLNWRVTVFVRGRKVMTVDYTKGQGHCPSYKWHLKECHEYRQKIIRECETGRNSQNRLIQLNAADVLHSIVMDCDVLNYSDFEEWASNLGFDTDSRKAEKIYNECLQNAKALRKLIGDEELQKLQEIANDM